MAAPDDVNFPARPPRASRCTRGRGEGRLGSSLYTANPRSSNGRTAAFGAVNRGSNPCRGASRNRLNLFYIEWLKILDASSTSNAAERTNGRPRRVLRGDVPGSRRLIAPVALAGF